MLGDCNRRYKCFSKKGKELFLSTQKFISSMPDTPFQTYMRHRVVQSDNLDSNRLKAYNLKDMAK